VKATTAQIRERFDCDVERFSNLETGQTAIIDAPLMLELIAEAAAVVTPGAGSLLDVGCGAGNYSLKLLQRLPGMDVTLLDLSRPMLERAVERVSPATTGRVEALQTDIRGADLGDQRFDVITAAAVLHHLRTVEEWEAVFRKLHASLRPGGSLWIADMIRHDNPALQAMLWRRYGDYLTALRDETYRDHVYTYVEFEDTPQSLPFQLDLLRRVGFRETELLHKTSVFAAFGAVK
jgi:tRNA (cmo5U34)-methyltransferase